MDQFFSAVREAFSGGLLSSIGIFDILDILIMTVIIYQILKFFKNTKAIHVLKGIAILILALAVASWLGLPTLTWVLSSVFTSGILIVIVLFQPELRRAFENLGRGRLFDKTQSDPTSEEVISQLIKVSENLSKRRVGALMVFQQSSQLKDIIDTGTLINADISAGLIENIFEPNTPLHDGAMIISGEKIIAAGCFLPLSENNSIEKTLGTRHRAALGVSEQSDAVVVVVSEETGVISVARNGSFQRYLDLDGLKNILEEIYSSNNSRKNTFAKIFGKEFFKNEN